MDADDSGGIIHDCAIIEQRADRAFERVATMVGSVPHQIHEDGREGVESPKLILGDFHEDGE